MTRMQGARFLEQLATLLEAGVPIVQGLQRLGATGQRGPGRAWARRLAAEIEAGESAAGALARHPRVLRRDQIRFLGAAEQQAGLPLGLRECARELEQEVAHARAWWSALAYPFILLHVAIALPSLYMLVTGSAAAYVEHVLTRVTLVDGAIVSMWLLYRLAQEVAGLREMVDGALLLIPALGAGRARLEQARFLRALSGLYAVGISIPGAYQTARLTYRNRFLAARAAKLARRLDNGAALDWVVGRLPWIPAEAEDILAVHRTAGSLDRGLLLIATDLHQRGERSLDAFRKFVPKLVYLAVAGYVAYVVIQFWASYYGGVIGDLESLLGMVP